MYFRENSFKNTLNSMALKLVFVKKLMVFFFCNINRILYEKSYLSGASYPVECS